MDAKQLANEIAKRFVEIGLPPARKLQPEAMRVIREWAMRPGLCLVVWKLPEGKQAILLCEPQKKGKKY